MNSNKLLLVAVCATISFGALHAMDDVVGFFDYSRPSKKQVVVTVETKAVAEQSPVVQEEVKSAGDSDLPREVHTVVTKHRFSACKSHVQNGFSSLTNLVTHNPYTRLVVRGADSLENKVSGGNEGVIYHLATAYAVALRNHPYLTPLVTAFVTVTGVKALYNAYADDEDEDFELYGDNEYRCSYYTK